MTLAIKEVTLRIEGKALLHAMSFTVEPGRVFSLMGRSGCGKSSLLSFITGTLDTAFDTAGHVVLDGVNVTDQPPHKRHIGIQFQDHLLFPHMTVGENLAFGLPKHIRRKARNESVLQALDDCDLGGVEHRDPTTLSGGQRARVSLMRTLLSEPKALLLDEPFSKLDQALKAEFRRFVFERIIERQIPAIIVTHDPEDIFDSSAWVRL